VPIFSFRLTQTFSQGISPPEFMKLSRSPIYLFPAGFSLSFALFLFWVAGAPKDESEWFNFSLSLICSYGFWCLFFALSQWFYKKSRYWLFLLIPVFLGIVLFSVFQLVHLYLFQNYVTLSRFSNILMHLYLVFPELFRNFSEFGCSIPISITLGLAAIYLSFLALSKNQIFRPFKWKGLGSATVVLFSLIWMALPTSHNLNFSYQMPDMAGNILSLDSLIRKVQIRFLSKEKNYISQSEGYIDRKNTVSLGMVLPKNKEKLPNIILVLLESVRSDHLSIYGYHRETTPFLKKIAQESTTYQTILLKPIKNSEVLLVIFF